VREDTSISLLDHRFAPALAEAFQKMGKRAREQGIDVAIRMPPHPLRRESIIERGIAAAQQSGTVRLESSRGERSFQTALSEEEASAILRRLPGGEELFMQLAYDFLELFNR